VAAHVDLVIVHGGDGTVNEAIQALVGTSTPLAVWPAGTSNVLARELALPGSLDLLARVIAGGAIRRVSVGRAGERYFLLMAGVGLDADMLSSVHPGLKRLSGEGAYWMAGLRQLTDWNPVPFTVETEDGPHRATFAVVANASSYGGGLRFAPDASMDDDLLDLCLFDSTQRHRFARYLAAAFSGSHLGMPGVSYVKARRAVDCRSASTACRPPSPWWFPRSRLARGGIVRPDGRCGAGRRAHPRGAEPAPGCRSHSRDRSAAHHRGRRHRQDHRHHPPHRLPHRHAPGAPL
jgi:YegS/Rv2252/BmrU family lipid kinase